MRSRIIGEKCTMAGTVAGKINPSSQRTRTVDVQNSLSNFPNLSCSWMFWVSYPTLPACSPWLIHVALSISLCIYHLFFTAVLSNKGYCCLLPHIYWPIRQINQIGCRTIKKKKAYWIKKMRKAWWLFPSLKPSRPYLYCNTASRCCMLVLPACWCSMLVLHVDAPCWCCMLVLHAGAAYWCCILVLHAGAACWCCTTTQGVQKRAAIEQTSGLL